MKIKDKELLKEGRFISLKEIKYEDSKGKERLWESVERNNLTGVVNIIATVKQKNLIVVVKQWRPPVGDYIYEFPAGLIDNNETPQEAAIRELKEETGLIGDVKEILGPFYSSAGLTNECSYFVFVDVEKEKNKNIKQELEDGEEIETFVLLPEKELLNSGKFDAKLAMFLIRSW